MHLTMPDFREFSNKHHTSYLLLLNPQNASALLIVGYCFACDNEAIKQNTTQTEDNKMKNTDIRELNMEMLEDVNGGVVIPIVLRSDNETVEKIISSAEVLKSESSMIIRAAVSIIVPIGPAIGK